MFKHVVIGVLLVVPLLMLGGVSVMAQEETPAAPEVITIVEEAPSADTIDGVEDIFALTDLARFIINAAILLLSGGAIGFAVGVARMNKQQKDTSEQLYMALPPSWAKVFRDLVIAGKATFNTLDQVTDGLPNSDNDSPRF